MNKKHGDDYTRGGDENITPAQRAEYEEAFELFDKDGDGTISTGELKNLLRCFGQKATDDDVANYLAVYNKEKGEDATELEFEDFVDIMKKLITEPDIDQEIQEVYKVFDRDEKGINPQELSKVMTDLLRLKMKHKQGTLGPGKDGVESGILDEDLKKYEITLQEAEDMINESDMDGDGRLSFEEFARILMEKPEKPKSKY